MSLITMINQLLGHGWVRVTKSVWVSPEEVIYGDTPEAYKELVREMHGKEDK